MQYDYNYHANRYLTGNRDVISDINKNQVSIITGLQFPFLYDETRLNFLGNYYFTDLYKKNYQIYEIYPDKTKFTKYMISLSIDYLF